MKKLGLFLLFTCLCITLQSYIRLNEVMTPEEQKMTGVDKLSAKQRAALQAWLNKKFELKETPGEYANEKIFIVENHNGGTLLYMSNQKVYEVAPEDRAQAAFWLSPFPITVDVNPSNAEYPLKLINTSIGTGIAVRELTPDEVRAFEEEDRLRRQNKKLEEELKALQSPPSESHPHPHPHPTPPSAPVETAPTGSLETKEQAEEMESHLSSVSPSEEWEEEVELELPSEKDF